MTSISRLNLQEINFEELLKVMQEGLKLLDKLRKNWSKLVEFFSMIATCTDASLKTIVNNIASDTNGFLGNENITEDARSNYREDMKDNVILIQHVAYSLHLVSKAYVQVSQKYVTTAMAGLPSLLSAESPGERQKMLQKLYKNSKAATAEIEQLAKDQRGKFQANVAALITEAEKQVQKYDAAALV